MSKVIIPEDLQVGRVHSSNRCGKFEITSYSGYLNIKIKFKDTGFITTVTSGPIRTGEVRDKTYPQVFGVGFVGQGVHLATYLGKSTVEYDTWASMLRRCYSEKSHLKSPTYKNCTVALEWHNYQNFASWFKEHYREGLSLDKDILQRGVTNKVYSPDTCMFITRAQNTIESSAKEYMLKNPQGEAILVKNMSEFCRNTPKITPSGMSQMITGRRRSHKGWTLWVEP